ncbi:MAG: PGF-CTERM protein [Haloarculaceae archaeon]|jgi:PGF-CTERM protein
MVRSSVSAVVLVLIVAAIAQGTVGGAAAADVTLTITVVDSDGDPVSGVDIQVTWNGTEGGPVTETTFPNGKAFAAVPEGSNVEITIDNETYIRNTPYVLFNARNQDVEVPVSRSGTATVTVQSDEGPVSSAEVSLTGDSGELDTFTTDEDGVITTGRLERGTYDFTVSKPGFFSNDTSITVGNDTSETIRLRRGTVEAQFSVVDDHFGPPESVANATIEIPRLGTTLSTLSDGTRSTNVPVNREYEVTITKDGYETETTTLTVRESSVSSEVAIQRTPTVDVEPTNERVVVGESTIVTVTNEYDEHVEGATVSVDGDTVGTTDSDGQLTVPINQSGNVTVEATSGDAADSVTIEGIEASERPTPTVSTPTPTEPQSATPTEAGTGTATDPATETPGDSGPGFGVFVTVLALLATGLLARWR